MDIKKLFSIAGEIHETIGRNHDVSIYVNALECNFELNNIQYIRNARYSLVYKNKEIGEVVVDFYFPQTDEILKVFSYEKNYDLVPDIELLKNQSKNINKNSLFINFIRSRKGVYTSNTETENHFFERKQHVIIGRLQINEQNNDNNNDSEMMELD